MRLLRDLLKQFRKTNITPYVEGRERERLLQELLELKIEQGGPTQPPPYLYRYKLSGEGGARELAEGGFRQNLVDNPGPGIGVGGEPSGLYWAKSKDDLGNLITGSTTNLTYEPNIWGQPLPGTKMLSFTPDEAKLLRNVPGPQITKAFNRDANFLKWPDTVVDRPWEEQVVQVRPESTKALIETRWKDPSSRVTRILGLTGALGVGGSMVDTNEAQASPIKRVLQDASKLALGPASSAAARLIGKSFPEFEGRVVKDVRQGRGDQRFILFKDGMVAEVTKKDLNDLARTTGTEEYVSKFQAGDEATKKAMALKSLRRREAMHSGLVRKSTVTEKASEHLKSSKSVSGLQEDIVGVVKDGKYMTMPRPYAEYLQKAGILKITKEIPK